MLHPFIRLVGGFNPHAMQWTQETLGRVVLRCREKNIFTISRNHTVLVYSSSCFVLDPVCTNLFTAGTTYNFPTLMIYLLVGHRCWWGLVKTLKAQGCIYGPEKPLLSRFFGYPRGFFAMGYYPLFMQRTTNKLSLSYTNGYNLSVGIINCDPTDPLVANVVQLCNSFFFDTSLTTNLAVEPLKPPELPKTYK